MKNEIFSERESKILSIIGESKIKVREVFKKYYGEGFELRSVGSIYSSINKIRMKAELNKLNWRLETEGMGRRGKTVWRREA